MELQPTRLMGQNSPERVRYLSPTTSERATGSSTEGFRGDPGIVDSPLRRLRDERLISSIQRYARRPYDPDRLGGLPLFEAVLMSAFAEVVNRCEFLQRRLHEAVEARQTSEARLANSELLVNLLCGEGQTSGASGMKRPRAGSPR
jgi:hypothetical protein